MADLATTVIYGDLKITGDLIVRNYNADLLDGLNSTQFLRSDVTTVLNGGALYIANPAGGTWTENLRLVPADNGWTTIHMGGALGATGTAPGQWSLHTYQNQFRICNGGSGSEVGLNLTDNAITWKNNTVWHAGNDGHGSGLDADTWDGYQVGYLPTTKFLKENNDIEGGQIVLEKPTNSALSGDVVIDSFGNILRIYEGAGSCPGAYLDFKTCAGGVGSKIWHSENDGHDSGLDADLWDGHHASGRNNWLNNGVVNLVIGQLAWKNFGNGHTIFDASQSTSPDGTAVNNTNAQAAWNPTYPTLMGWNGSNTYGVRVDSARLSDFCSNVVVSSAAPASPISGTLWIW